MTTANPIITSKCPKCGGVLLGQPLPNTGSYYCRCAPEYVLKFDCNNLKTFTIPDGLEQTNKAGLTKH